MPRYVIKKSKIPLIQIFEGKPQWDSVEITEKVPPAVLQNMVELQEKYAQLHDYLIAIYGPLRQTGAADVSNVEVPQCVASSSAKSRKPSKRRASSSSTKRSPTSSTSPSSEDTAASTAAPKE